jgi:hypothetical protein
MKSNFLWYNKSMIENSSNSILERTNYKNEEQRQLGSYCVIATLADVTEVDGELRVWDVPDDVVGFKFIVLDCLTSAQDLIIAHIYNDPELGTCNLGFNKPDNSWTLVYCVSPFTNYPKAAFRILTTYNPYESHHVNGQVRFAESSLSSPSSWKYHIGYEAFKDIGGNFVKKENGEYKNTAINSDYYEDKSVDDRLKKLVESN